MTKLLTAKDLQKKIAESEAAKASAAMKAHAAAEAEKKAFLDHLSNPSGLTDEQIIEKARNHQSRRRQRAHLGAGSALP